MKLRIVLVTLFASTLLATHVIVPATSAESAPRRVEVTAKKFAFTPDDITLKKGEPVVLVIKNSDVPHGVRFRELGVATKAGKDKTSELAFTPDKTGTFVGQCSIFCGSGHGGMKLTLHVVE